jgi:tRNA pseudouridine38-40 synthase
MLKFRAVVEYDGTAYHGWQLQKDLPTIQGTMETALSKMLQTFTRVHGAGRTDAGVHATGQVAHFLAKWPYPVNKLQRACNSLLPRDIVIRRLEIAEDDFHARHSARSKTYVYRVLHSAHPSPMKRLYSWHVPFPLDHHAMGEAARHIIGVHDFMAFGSPTDGTPSTDREILDARWEKGSHDELLRFTIKGTGFLRYMVRTIVGTLVMVGRGKMSPAELHQALESLDRSCVGPTAPAHGLCLVSVDYNGS